MNSCENQRQTLMLESSITEECRRRDRLSQTDADVADGDRTETGRTHRRATSQSGTGYDSQTEAWLR